MSIGLGTAIGYLKLDVSGFASGVDSAISDMNRLNDNFSTAAQGLQTIGGMFTKAGTTLTAGFTAPVIGFGAASVKAGTEFDASMSQVAAVSKATGADLETIRDRAIEMGEKTRYSAAEVSDAMYYMGLAGWDTTQIYKGIPGVLALGAASGEDLARVSDIVTDSLTAFGKSADDTTEFVNILAEATRSSNTTVDMLGESFKYVGPVAGAFGYSLQDVAVALGIFADNGVKGSQAGTGLRQALNSLINPSEKAAALMDNYGVSLFNTDGTAKDLMTVMEELRGTFGGLAIDIKNADGEIMTGEEIMEKYGHSLPTSEMEKLTAMVQIFGVRALPGMLSVVNATDESFYGLRDAIYGAQDAYDGLGTAFGMQETMLDNLQGDWYMLTSALDTTKIIISDMAKGALRDLVQGLTELVRTFNNMDEEQREQIIKWALMTASIGPILIVIGKLISGIGSLITTFNTLKGVFSFIQGGFKGLSTGFSAFGTAGSTAAGAASKLGLAIGGITVPIAAVIAVVAVLVAAFANLWMNNEEFRNKIIEIWKSIVAKFIEAGQRIVEIFNELGFNFKDFSDLMSAAIEGLKVLWNGFCEILAPIFVGAFKLISNAIKGFIDVFVGVMEIVLGFIKGIKDGDWSMFLRGISDVVMAFAKGILSILDILLETIWNVIVTIANLFGASWSTLWNNAKQAIGDFFSSLAEWFAELPGKIADFFGSLLEFVASIPGKVAEALSNILEITTQWVIDMVSKALEFGSEFIDNIVTFFVDLPSRIGEFLSSVLENVSQWTSDMIQKALEVGTDFVNNIISFFSELPDKMAYWLGYVIGTVIKWSLDMVDKARETGSEFLQNIVDFFMQLPGNIHDFITSALDNVRQWSSDMISEAREVGQKFLNNVISFFQQLPGKIQSLLITTINNVSKWVTDMKNKATEVAKGFFDNIIKGLADLPGKMVEIGSNIVKGIWNGISSGWSWLVNKVKDLAKSLLKGAKDALGIHSPSSLFRDQIGKWLPPGIGEGFSDAMPALIKDMQKEIDDGVDALSTDEVKPFELMTDEFTESYLKAFEGIVIWFETLEDRMATAIENLMDYIKYLLYVRQIIDNDEGFKDFVLGGDKDNKPKKLVDSDVSSSSSDSGGDIYIFNSPKPIDEVQAARLMRDTKRDLAEGF